MILHLLILSLSSWICHGQEDELILVQLVHRHGAKVPDQLEDSMRDFWEQIGYPGELTPEGQFEMESLGREIRQRYINNEVLLPDEYDPNQLHVRTSSAIPRTVSSPVAAMFTLYPGAPVPVYTVDPAFDLLMMPHRGPCPSFQAETDIRQLELEQEILANYSEVYHGFQAITDFPVQPRADVFMGWWMWDKLECEMIHGVQSNDYLLANADVVVEMAGRLWNRHTFRQEPFDARGNAFSKLANTFIDNFEAAISSDSPVRLHWYSDHTESIMGIKTALIQDPGEAQRGITSAQVFVVELRRSAIDGRYYVQAEDLKFDHSQGYVATPTQLLCPNPSFQCELSAFSAHVRARNNEEGCCIPGRGFEYYGCDDYLNPDVLNRVQCLNYRIHCPQTACGRNQVVDRATLLCVPVA